MDSKRGEPVPLVGASRRAGRYDHAVKPPAEAGADGTLAGPVPGRAARSLVLVAILAATLAACGDRDGSAPGSAAPPVTTAVVAAQEPEPATGSDSEPTTIPVPTAEPVAVPASTAPESTPVASNDPEQPSAAPPAAEPAPEPPTDTDTPQDGATKSTAAASNDPEQPSAAPPAPEPTRPETDSSQDGVPKSTLAAVGEDPEQPSAAPPASEPAPEPPTDTDVSQRGVPKSTLAAVGEDPEQPSVGADVSGAGVSTGGLRGPPPDPPPEGERVVSKGDRRGGGGVPYVWRDGDRIRRARLQADLVLQPSSDNREDDVVVRNYGSNSIVERRTRHAGSGALPVFRDEGGSLATLPGGVLVVLDPDWDQGRVNRFFSANGIKRSRVIEQAFADNAYLVETDPGFPSLELANELAELDGVVLSSPNWQTEITFR